MDWQPISEASDEIKEIASYMPTPQLGSHIGRTATLSDGRWVVLQWPPAKPGLPEQFCVIPGPPHVSNG